MNDLNLYCRLIRHAILTSTTEAGSGHPSSCLSAVELVTALFFGGFLRYFPDNPHHPNNDRFILSKGHAAPLLYAAWAVAGAIPFEDLNTLRKFISNLEGHPTKNFPYTEVATGSLGQGLSVGVGMALNAKYLDKLPYKTYVLLGDSEMAEGSNWEAIQLAAYYKLNNLVGIIDVNRLGQRGETMYGSDISAFAERVQAFGWHVICVDGHSLEEITQAYTTIQNGTSDMPYMIIASTRKGKGVSIMEDKVDWHGKALSKEQCEVALKEIGHVDNALRGTLGTPEDLKPASYDPEPDDSPEEDDEKMSTREAYGHALVKLHDSVPDMVVLDAEMSNSTFAAEFKKVYPERFFEMFIAEQNMVGVAVGLAARGKIPYISTFGSFFTRAVDQIRVAQYSQSHINCIGSHVGVSIGQDGATQMGLEDMAVFRAILDSVVLYPADRIASEKLVEAMATQKSICYMRISKMEVEQLYTDTEEFHIGGSKVLRTSPKDTITIVAAGVTLYEALKAHEELEQQGISTRIIDAYSIKPIDTKTLQDAARETKAFITVEDHYADGGLGDAVRAALSDRPVRIYSLAVRKMPHSGTPEELLDFEEISAKHIIKKVTDIIRSM